MTADAAVAFTALLVFATGFVVATTGFTFPTDEASREAKILRAVGFVGVGMILLAIVMWIISIWMQVR